LSYYYENPKMGVLLIRINPTQWSAEFKNTSTKAKTHQITTLIKQIVQVISNTTKTQTHTKTRPILQSSNFH